MTTPAEVLVIRERLGWTDEQLKATPSRVVRDFLVIASYERSLAENG